MKLLFKEKVFSWLDSYDVFNEEGDAVYTVKGKLSFGHRLIIKDVLGSEVGLIQEKVLSMPSKFEMIVQDEVVGVIQKEFSLFKPKFTISCNGWRVEGNIWEWEYDVFDNDEIIMHVSKEIWNLSDTYMMDIKRNEDALYCLMIVLAIDAAKCKNND